MMNLLRRVIKWFKGPTPEEAYAKGQALVLLMLKESSNREQTAEYLYGAASGGFNSSRAHHEFDRGVRDQLEAVGHPSPY